MIFNPEHFLMIFFLRDFEEEIEIFDFVRGCLKRESKAFQFLHVNLLFYSFANFSFRFSIKFYFFFRMKIKDFYL